MPTKLIIALTGANGQIGSGIIQHALDEGHTVVALDKAPESKFGKRDGYTYKSVELTDYDAFLEAARGCDALIHLAATYSLQNPKDPDGPLLRSVPDHVSQLSKVPIEQGSFLTRTRQVVHNTNTAMSWNALSVAAELGIKRVSIASSVNAIGLSENSRHI
jgi:UDP-glucose 4-epimerase